MPTKTRNKIVRVCASLEGVQSVCQFLKGVHAASRYCPRLSLGHPDLQPPPPAGSHQTGIFAPGLNLSFPSGSAPGAAAGSGLVLPRPPQHLVGFDSQTLKP